MWLVAVLLVHLFILLAAFNCVSNNAQIFQGGFIRGEVKSHAFAFEILNLSSPQRFI